MSYGILPATEGVGLRRTSFPSVTFPEAEPKSGVNVIVPPNETEAPPSKPVPEETVIEELVKELFGMLERVFDAASIVLLVRDCVPVKVTMFDDKAASGTAPKLGVVPPIKTWLEVPAIVSE